MRADRAGADGSMRDALSLLDQVLAFGGGRALEAEARSLLGTLDRKHVEAILAALAAGDGKALMQSVATLDERAPDYHQALDELAGALQRMALLQALPELPDRRRRRGRGACPHWRRALRRRTCSSTTRSRSSAAAISTTRPMRAADSR